MNKQDTVNNLDTTKEAQAMFAKILNILGPEETYNFIYYEKMKLREKLRPRVYHG